MNFIQKVEILFKKFGSFIFQIENPIFDFFQKIKKFVKKYIQKTCFR